MNVIEKKGTAYFKDWRDADAHRKTHAPAGRLVEYLLGWAVQVRKSGPYLDKKGVARCTSNNQSGAGGG